MRETNWKDYMERMEKSMYMRLCPHVRLRFEVHLVEHCNLNCRYCGHYSPLAKKEYLDPHEYKNDCLRLSELFDHTVERILLIGGEPLLHPQIVEIMKITREAFPIGEINIVTNGILLSEMGNDFWDACRECRIKIEVTEYPSKINYDKCREYAAERGVAYQRFNGPEEKFMVKKILRLKPVDSPEKNYMYCDLGNSCITLKHGKMYTCTTAAHAHLLKDFFNLDLELSEKNGIDIYAVKDGEELTTKLARPIPLCENCDLYGNIWEGGYDWGISRKERYDWCGFEFTDADVECLKAAPSVYVFGAGDWGVKTVVWLQRHGINPRAVLASRIKESLTSISGVPIINIKDLGEIEKDSVILIAAYRAETKLEIRAILAEYGYECVVPVYGPKNIGDIPI